MKIGNKILIVKNNLGMIHHFIDFGSIPICLRTSLLFGFFATYRQFVSDKLRKESTQNLYYRSMHISFNNARLLTLRWKFFKRNKFVDSFKGIFDDFGTLLLMNLTHSGRRYRTFASAGVF